jgi:signal peptidase I
MVLVATVTPVVAGCAVGAVVGLLRRRWIAVTVEGWSMAPALRPGDRILVRRRSGAALRNGQVVVLYRSPPGRPTELVIKRVAALPGDAVPAVILPALGQGAADRVPAGKLVLFGDNTARSADSRVIGYYQLSDVVGVVARPLNPAR